MIVSFNFFNDFKRKWLLMIICIQTGLRLTQDCFEMISDTIFKTILLLFLHRALIVRSKVFFKNCDTHHLMRCGDEKRHGLVVSGKYVSKQAVCLFLLTTNLFFNF